MPGDLIISDASLHAAPKETPVPASTRYIVKQVQALYTDNGAGGAWLPALEIVSDAGIVTGRYVGESVAAGAGQEVTWFPLGSKGAVATASAAVVFGIAYRSAFNVPSSVGGSFANLAPWDYIDSSGSGVDLDGSGRVQINTAGLYVQTWTVEVFDNTWALPVNMTLDTNFITGGTGNELQTTSPGLFNDYPGYADSFGKYATQLTQSNFVNILTPPEQLNMRILFIQGAGAHQASNTFASCSVLRVGDYSTGGVT